MRFTSRTSSDGVTEQLFILDEIPGVLWTPEGACGIRPLILIGHGGGQHKKAPGNVARARRFAAEGGFAVAAFDAPNHGDRPKDEKFTRVMAETRARVEAGENAASAFEAVHVLLAHQSVPEWRTALTALQDLDGIGAGPVGYLGVSMGCGLGMPFVAAEPRVRAAVLGLFASPTLAEAAARITAPVQYLVQWDDEQVPRAESLAVFDALASKEKTLHANPGGHMDVPRFETDSALRFFQRHLDQGAPLPV
jgi:dienelactone hydrolase